MSDATIVPTRAIALEMYEELFNKRNNEVLEKYIAEDFVYRNPIQDTVGRQQIVDLVAAQHESFREYKQSVDEVVVDLKTPSMAVSWTATGFFEKDFFGFKATGKPMTFSGITLFLWKNGQAYSGWGFSNMSEGLAS